MARIWAPSRTAFSLKVFPYFSYIFPNFPGIIHPFVSEVNLTKCGITRISPRTFASIPKTEFLDLSDNVIEYAGKETFDQLEKYVRNL